MAWITLDYKVEEVNAAGKILMGAASKVISYDTALEIINNWRSCHSFPLHIHYVRLRRYATIIDARSLVARRLKRLSSIELKLQRFERMKLSQMQDIGGCRAIVSSVPKVRELVHSYKESSRKHQLVHEDDYINNPQATGYRGVHLIYRYQSDKNQIYNDRKGPMEVRSTHPYLKLKERISS